MHKTGSFDKTKLKISVIIPALNEEDTILTCINAARRDYTSQEVEIIVADGGSCDRTLEKIPQEVTTIQTQPRRATQMNAGATQAGGEVFLFCHADTHLPEGWREDVIEALSEPQVAGGVFRSQFEPAVGILKWRNRIVFPEKWWLMYGDQCQFTYCSTFEDIGGFPEIPLMEDVELSRALSKRGKVVRLKQRAITSSRRLLEKGVLRITIKNIIRVIGYHHFGVSAEQIAKGYHSSREEKHG